MAARPSPRAPHSSTCPKLSAALSPSRRPVSGLAPASEPLAREPTGSFGDSPCTGLTIARGPGLQRPVSPAAGGGGRRRRERRPGPPPSRTHDGRGDGTGGPGRHLCAGHAPTVSRPLARMPGPGWAGPARGRALSSTGLLRLSTRGLPPNLQVFFPLHCSGSGLLLRLGSLLSLTDRAQISLRYLHGAALSPFQ